MSSAQTVVLPEPKIAINIICKDNEATISNCLESFKGCNVFFNITDTGSTDGTEKAIRKTAKRLHLPYSISHFTWEDHFARARNYNLQQTPEDCSWMLWVDSDDVVEGFD